MIFIFLIYYINEISNSDLINSESEDQNLVTDISSSENHNISSIFTKNAIESILLTTATREYDEYDDFFDDYNDEIPPIFPSQPTEEVVYRDQTYSTKFNFTTIFGLFVIFIIGCILIVWKFYPRICGSQNDDRINNFDIEQFRADSIDQLDIEANADQIDQWNDNNQRWQSWLILNE